MSGRRGWSPPGSGGRSSSPCGARAEAEAVAAELASLGKAVASAQENYEIVQAEYRQNIVTNLEVMTSFNTLQRARLDHDRARFEAKLARIRLDVECGGMTP